jgi:ubiquitin-conjugating enzyme E2 variant
MTAGLNGWDVSGGVAVAAVAAGAAMARMSSVENTPGTTSGQNQLILSTTTTTTVTTVTTTINPSSTKSLMSEEIEPTIAEKSDPQSLASPSATSTTSCEATPLTKQRVSKAGRNHAGAKYLASQYTRTKRIQEIIGLAISLPLIAFNLLNFLYYFDLSRWYVIFAASVVAILTADLLSGIIHWAADSYGSVDMWLVGKNILRNFREHHIDPTAITRHDFVETNGDNFTIIVPVLAYLAYSFVTSPVEVIQARYNWSIYFYLLSVFISLTNQVLNFIIIYHFYAS